MRTNTMLWVIPLALASSAAPALGQEAVRRVEVDEPLRIRLGAIGGVSGQPNEMAVGVGYDFITLNRYLKLDGDFTVGAFPYGVTLEPMIGLRVPFAIQNAERFHPYVGGLVGYNMTWDANVVRVAMPFRMATGAYYDVRPGLGLGGELAMEIGPSFAPFPGTYGAVHLAFGVTF